MKLDLVIYSLDIVDDSNYVLGPYRRIEVCYSVVIKEFIESVACVN